MEQVTGEQIRLKNETLAINALNAIEQMRQQFVCSGSDHDKLRMAVANLQQFISDAGKKPEPAKKPNDGKDADGPT